MRREKRGRSEGRRETGRAGWCWWRARTPQWRLRGCSCTLTTSCPSPPSTAKERVHHPTRTTSAPRREVSAQKEQSDGRRWNSLMSLLTAVCMWPMCPCSSWSACVAEVREPDGEIADSPLDSSTGTQRQTAGIHGAVPAGWELQNYSRCLMMSRQSNT